MHKTDLSRFNNDDFKDSPLARGLVVTVAWFITKTIFIQSNLLIPMVVKKFILTLFGAKIGKNVVIKNGINVKFPWNLEVGNNVWLGEGLWIENQGKVKIGDNVCLSQGSMLLSGNHDYKKPTFDLIVKDIILEEGVWIGAKSVVCNGVTCHSHAVLSVNSVATKSLDAYCIYQGNPAIMVRKREIAIR